MTLPERILELQKMLLLKGLELPTEPSDGAWTRCKLIVDKLTPRYREVIALAEKNDPFSIRIKKTGKDNKISSSLMKEIEGFLVMFELIEDSGGAAKNATYYAFNHIENIAYIREIV